MKECDWVRPELGADHLRHTKFVAIRDEKDPSRVVREMAIE
jgi:bifunctional non-homologous end joining protein LigD